MNIIIEPPIERKVTLEMTLTEARILQAWAGNTRGDDLSRLLENASRKSDPASAGTFLQSLFITLTKLPHA